MLSEDKILNNIKDINSNLSPFTIEFKLGFNTNKFFAYFDILDNETGEEFTEVSKSSHHLLSKYMDHSIN
jgi:hypothetical protein